MASVIVDEMLALQWVQANERQIRGKAKKFQAYSPYDVEDYIQDANEAAILAVQVCRAKQVSFQETFWRIFKNHASNVSTNPALRDVIPETAYPDANTEGVDGDSLAYATSDSGDGDMLPVSSKAPCRFLSYDESLHSQHYLPLSSIEFFEDPPLDQHRAFMKIRGHLKLQLYRDVWTLLLGLSDEGRFTLSEAATRLGVDKPRVVQAYRRSLNEVAKLIRKKVINVEELPRLRMVSIAGASLSSNDDSHPVTVVNNLVKTNNSRLEASAVKAA